MIRGDRAESNRCQTDSQSVSGNQHRIRPQRKERELNPQDIFTFDRLPTGSRRQSGGPSVGGGRLETEGLRKLPVEFASYAFSGSLSSRQQAEGKGVEPSSACRTARVSKRPGKPYPATFHFSGLDGSRTHHTDLARISRLHRHASPVESPVLSHQFSELPTAH